MKDEKIVRLDVRPDIRSGREPFGRIMSAISSLEEGQSLCLIAPFEPKPLFGVLAARGFSHSSKPIGSGDYEVLFTPVDAAPTGSATTASSPASKVAYREIDTRGLQPPEPLVKILEALSDLPEGTELMAITDRRPMHLYTQLTERNFVAETEERPDGSHLTRIRRA